MTAITTLVLVDGATTPVNHTLTPDFGQNADRGAQWSEKTAANPLLRLRATLKIDTTTKGVTRVTPSVIAPVPYVAGVNCCPTLADPIVQGTNYGNAIFSFYPLSTEQQRLDVLAELISFLQKPEVKEAVRNGAIQW